MEAPATIFAIPTYRLRDVPETVERYDENFWLNGNEVALIVFDDSSLVNHHKYYAQLKRRALPTRFIMSVRGRKNSSSRSFCIVCASRNLKGPFVISSAQATGGTGTSRLCIR